jgi:gas vesicle protein
VDDRSTSTYPPNLLTFLLGGLAGASLALLFAPQSGRATRQSMRRHVQDGVDAARDLGQRVTRKGRELAGEGERTMRDALASAERGAERLDQSLRSSDTTL